MKVLKNNYHNEYKENTRYVEPYPRKITCECCDSELEYDEEDVVIGEFGCVYVICPLCDSKTFLYDNEKELTLTKNNVEFPVHFHHTSVENGAVDTCNNGEVKSCIHKGINFLRSNNEEYYWYTEYGNLFVAVFKHSGDECYDVIVTKDYYETSIPFEEVDY